MVSVPKPAELDPQALDKFRESLSKVNKAIHSNPELAYSEHRAHDAICDALTSLGYTVTRHAFGLDTSFQAEYGYGGAVVAFNAEYDALPGIGHACGHNLIATSSLAAFLLTANHLADTGAEGRVRLLGTPAEEAGGGKVDLIEAGAYKDVDACLMGHPFPPDGDSVILPRLMARAGVRVTFRGVNAHAGNAPWLGKNALDAAVAAYTNIAMLRQQIPPNRRLHAIISKGGERPNIIPHMTELSLYVRGETAADVDETCQRIVDCCEGGARAAGCTVEFDWEKMYKDLQCNEAIAKCFQHNAKIDNQPYQWTWDTFSGASTDQGNVSYEVPSLHPAFGIPVEKKDVGPHHPDFEHAAGQPEAFEAALKFAHLLAATGVDILKNRTIREEMWAEHRQRFGQA